jgi:hypothetical protein
MAGIRKFYAFRRRGLNVALEADRTARVEVSLDTDEGARTASLSLALMGPGDVQGLVKGTVTRRWPEPGSSKTPAGNVAYVEFAGDDLPWLLSPKSGDRPTPWLTLLVLPDRPESGLTWRADRTPLPEILIDASLSSTLPDPAEAWVLAHTEAREGGDLSRILSARWLASGTRWRAVLVPLFEAGRRAGLDEDIDGATGFAIVPGESLRLPVYDTWTFSTSNTPAFEDLIKDLAPADVASTPSWVTWSGPTKTSLDATEPVARSWLRAALKHARMNFEAVSDAPRYTAPRMVHSQAAKLRKIIDRQGAICPPRYGRWTGSDGKVPTGKWFDDINLDPSLRLAAGYGGEIVRRHQEKLVRAAWDFAGEVEEANHVIASARLGSQSARKLHARVSALSPDRLIALSEPAHGRIHAPVGQGSCAATIAGTAYEGFGRASRIMRRAARLRLGATPTNVPDFTAEAEKRGTPFVPQGLPVLDAKFRNRPGRTQFVLDPDEALKLLAARLDVSNPQTVADDGRLGPALAVLRRIPSADAGQKNVRPLDASVLAGHLVEALDPIVATGARLADRISGGGVDPFEPIRPEPALDFPILEALAEISPGLVSPALSSMKPNSLTLLELDRPFCEALMVGANHELVRELIWRKYPGRLNMTPLRNLFPRQALVGETKPEDDTQPLASWAGVAGTHMTDSVKSLLLLRTDLFQLFPQTVMYVFPAVWAGDNERVLGSARHFEPVHARVRGRLPPDAMYLGYPLDASELRGTASKPAHVSPGSDVSAGYYLVFHGPTAQDSFGFDSPQGASAEAPVTALQKWDDLAWTHVGWQADRPNISLAGATLERPVHAEPTLVLGRDSASLAAIMASRSLTVAIHLSDLIDPTS